MKKEPNLFAKDCYSSYSESHLSHRRASSVLINPPLFWCMVWLRVNNICQQLKCWPLFDSNTLFLSKAFISCNSCGFRCFDVICGQIFVTTSA